MPRPVFAEFLINRIAAFCCNRHDGSMVRLDALRDALRQLERTFELLSKTPSQSSDISEIYRTAAIKSFEYVYEISVRLLRRHLEETAESPQEIAKMDFRPLIRTAAEKELIDDPVRWFLYREKRNITAHTYDATKAMDIITVLPEFIASAKVLLQALDAATDAR